MTYSGSTYSGLPYSGDDDETAGGLSITPASVGSGQVVPGLAAPFADVRTIRPASADRDDAVPGPRAPMIEVLRHPIRPLEVPSGQIVPGPWVVLVNGPVDPTVPVIPAGPARVHAGITVVGYEGVAKSVQVTPAVNGVGGGSFSIPFTSPPPAPDAVVGVNVSGRRVFTGLASRLTHVQRAEGDESAQEHQVELDGLLAEFGEVRVLPQLAASDLDRLGPPTQDARVFDWTMNGIGNESFGERGASIVPSVSVDARQMALEGLFQLPDVWPDPYARWMWVRNPRLTQPAGWCHFRVPTKRWRGRLQLWVCAYDYAEVWMDGTQMAVCDTPGVAQHVEVDSRYDFHLLTVKAYNQRGRAGVLLSLLPVTDDGQFGEPVMNSRSNWKALAYPDRTFISTPGQVLYRLRYEAVARGVWPSSGAGSWQFDFGNLTDSAGRPWPRLDPITLDVGMTYLDVLQRLATDRLDFAAAPAQRRLRAWVKDRGTGRERPPWWAPDVDLLSVAEKETVR